MKEELFVEGNDRFGYVIVHLQPARPEHYPGYTWMGKIDKLDFYFGGSLVKSYRTENLAETGLNKMIDKELIHIWRFALPGDFIVKGIESDHCSRRLGGNYFFVIESKAEQREPGDHIKQYSPDVQEQIKKTLHSWKQNCPDKNFFSFDLKSGDFRLIDYPPPIC
jgi:hypothetical protein